MFKDEKFRRQLGLTGIEMVLVVAIISILVGFLLPVYRTARQKTRRAVCMSNMKQIGQAIALYQTTYAKMPKSNDGTDDWWEILDEVDLIKTNVGKEDEVLGLYCKEFIRNHGQPSAIYTTYTMPEIQIDVSLDMFGVTNNSMTTILLSERDGSGASEGVTLVSESNLNQHQAGSNYLFMDGSVQFLTSGQAQSSSYCWPRVTSGSTNYC